MPNINSLLVKAIMAYRRGRYLPVPLSDQDGHGSLQETTALFIYKKLSVNDQTVYKTMMHLVGLAANLSRQTMYVDSRDILEKASEYLHRYAASDLLKQLGGAFIAQAESELEFQLKNFHNAKEYILKSLHKYQLLEQKHGMTFLH